jgi:predicted phage-related endonuclease
MSLTREQLEIRRTRIGSSEVGAILALDPYKSAYDVWTEKMLPPDGDGAKHQTWGLDLEPAILAHHARKAKYDLIGSPGTLIHPKAPLCATPDALAVPEGAPIRPVIDLQAKNDQGHGQIEWGEAGTDDAPLLYVAQVVVEMGVLRSAGYEVMHGELAVSIRGAPPVAYRIEFNEQLFGDVADLCARWVHDHLDTGKPPDGAPAEVAEYIRRRYARNDDNLLEATPERAAMVETVRLLRANRKALDDEVLAAENALKAAIGEASGIAGLCTWKAQKRAGHVVKPSESRVLRLTKSKEE